MLPRDAALAWYLRNRARSRAMFDLIHADADGGGAYYKKPIALRHPIVFYEGHLPAFSFNTLIKRALGGPAIDARLETIFARGIDPHESSSAPGADRLQWPSRDEVRAFADEADRRVLDALRHADLDRPGDALLDREEAVFTILEHEAMHQETLLYMWHRVPFEDKRRPADYTPHIDGTAPREEWIDVDGGCATLGVDRDAIAFGWDNEHPRLDADVAPFAIERFDVTNGRFLEFVEAGGYADPQWWRSEDWQWIQRDGISHPLFWERGTAGKGRVGGKGGAGAWYWRGMFERVPLPLAWPVYVSHAEASAFARWRGARLPTEAEFQRAAYGAPDPLFERPHPWGSAAPSTAHGVFDFSSWDPEPVGTHPAGRSAWGVDDLVGNGWEWTATPFAPFPGFRVSPSYPEYSADFFDGAHFVMKGASPATARELLRPTFRNWFRPRYPYVYATFRCVRDRGGRG
jgi:gamma-glutamyl hercynylcysteine S-oxide synthase